MSAVIQPLAGAREAVAQPAAPGGAPRTSILSRASGLPGRATLVLATVVITFVVAWSLWPELFATHDPITGVPTDKFLPPSTDHLFGTDYLGRDVFSRVVHGAGQSVSAALLAVGIGLIVGSALGLAGGFFGGWVDAIIGRLVDVLLAVPGFLFAVVIVVSLGFATVNAAVAVGVSSIAVFTRLMRSEVVRIKRLPFIESSLLVGGSRVGTLLRHVLPNAYESVVALAVLQFGVAILAISGLAFLGYGNPPPAPDWGLLVAEGKNYLSSAAWLVGLPGVVIVLTVLSLNRVSTSLRSVR